MAMDFRNSSLSTFTLLLLFTLYSPFGLCLNRKDEGNEVFCMCSSLEQEYSSLSCQSIIQQVKQEDDIDYYYDYDDDDGATQHRSLSEDGRI